MTRNAITAALIAISGTAAAQSVSITEIYPGISGEDGTVDWFEITNTGAANLDTGTLLYDDDGPNQLDGGALDSFILAPGEVAIFLISDDGAPSDDLLFGTAVEEFLAIWGNVANVGLTNGGGNLSQDGDSVNISTDGGLTFGTTAAFGFAFANSGATIDTTGAFANSVVGVNGAYVSNTFFNDNIGPGDGYTLIGSPGVIPAPASAALLGLGGLAAARRRR